ncbi:arabinosyltransferase domain-containing protein [Pseudonocardia sp. CA-142604]|uniref:arabinosyltransferase domain-containing protein n=1 Tax=Pseudonocardia sp. CA-142604 TaxID=3240024 RepID=UPI003D91A860
MTPPLRTSRGPRRAVFVLGLIAVLAAVAFPFAPVHQPDVRYSWTASDGPAAIPLMPYQPVDLTATVSCAVARVGGGPGGPPVSRELLSTVPLRPDSTAEPLYGLRLTASGDEVRVMSAGVDLGAVPLPRGACTLTVHSDPERTEVLVDGTPALTRTGDVRPDVAGAFSDVQTGVTLSLRTDTRFQTTISAIKAALAVVCVLALLGMLVALRRADRAVTPPVRLLPPRWWRPRPVDAVVVAVLGIWWLVGAITVDDGYIAGIVRSIGSNGFIGNVYRWLNAPEAPFSWFYDVYYAWSLISPSTLWMRLPSVLLGLLCWWLLSRLVLPRLGRFAAGRAAPWLAALALATWWVPLNLGLRPEPWVAVGTLAVFLAVERAVACRRITPLVVGLLLAGVTTAVTPAGLMAFTPFLAGALPVLRLLRARRDLHVLPVLTAIVAAPAAAVLLMVTDQSLAGMLEATRVRTLIGGGMPWYQEYERYSALLAPGSFEGSIGRRAAVLLTLLAAAGVLWALRGSRTGIATGPARRLVLGFLLSLATLTVSPTKWTQHFGDLAGYGAAVLVLGMVAWSAAAARRASVERPSAAQAWVPRGLLVQRPVTLREQPHRMLTALGAVTVVGALVLAGYNIWPYASNWFTPSFSTTPPQLANIPVATIALIAGGVGVGVLIVRSAWLRAGGATGVAVPRWVPGPTPLVAFLLVVVLALQVLSFVRVAVAHRDSYTLASDSLATLRGEPCGLQRLLSVETDPVDGLLPIATGSPTGRTLPVDVGGSTMPGIAVAGRMTTAWFRLDPQQRSGALPVVVTTSGETQPGDVLTVEFGVGDRVIEGRPVTADSLGPTDDRQMAPPEADTVRLAVNAPNAGPRSPAVASLPRVPRLTPMTDVLPPGTSAILDWPIAFLFPCLTPEPLPLGTAGLAQWRVGTPASDPSAGITYSAGFGGPFAAPRLLVTEQRMPTYLQGDPTRDAAQLYRWNVEEPLARPVPVITDRTVAGWERNGHARVPGLDPVG